MLKYWRVMPKMSNNKGLIESVGNAILAQNCLNSLNPVELQLPLHQVGSITEAGWYLLTAPLNPCFHRKAHSWDVWSNVLPAVPWSEYNLRLFGRLETVMAASSCWGSPQGCERTVEGAPASRVRGRHQKSFPAMHQLWQLIPNPFYIVLHRFTLALVPQHHQRP